MDKYTSENTSNEVSFSEYVHPSVSSIYFLTAMSDFLLTMPFHIENICFICILLKDFIMLNIHIGNNNILFVTFCSWLDEKTISIKNDFEGTLSAFDIHSHKMFIKDTSNSWFMFGIEEYSSIPKLLKFIHTYILENNISKIIFLGASMGGFAAILYGKLYSIKYKTHINVLAFSPQTNICKNNSILEYNLWTHNNIKNTIWNKTTNKLLNLSYILKIPSIIYIWCICCESVIFDSLNIDHISSYINKVSKITECNIHNSAYFLTKNRKINSIFTEILTH